jgi:hypothetical protein
MTLRVLVEDALREATPRFLSETSGEERPDRLAQAPETVPQNQSYSL